MKTLFKLNLLFVFFITSSAYCQYAWTDLIYHYQTGSIPPPHYFEYNLNINSGGTATLVYFPGYFQDTSWVYNFTIKEDDIKSLNDSIISSKALSEPIKEMPEHKHPIGGSMQNVTFILPQDPGLDQKPPTLVIPFFPQPQYKDALDNLYSSIKSLVPQSIWDEISAKKEDYMKNYKK
ncbi:MAG: hypothetical protein ABSF32_03815 [Ignavibacteria bacterium]|jgi:hypothetical protein